jgi:hypothetical protein
MSRQLVNDIVGIITNEGRADKKTGALDGEVPISHLRSRLADNAWKRLGSPGDFHSTIEEAGFKLRVVRMGSQYRTFVSIGRN